MHAIVGLCAGSLYVRPFSSGAPHSGLKHSGRGTELPADPAAEMLLIKVQGGGVVVLSGTVTFFPSFPAGLLNALQYRSEFIITRVARAVTNGTQIIPVAPLYSSQNTD